MQDDSGGVDHRTEGKGATLRNRLQHPSHQRLGVRRVALSGSQTPTLDVENVADEFRQTRPGDTGGLSPPGQPPEQLIHGRQGS